MQIEGRNPVIEALKARSDLKYIILDEALEPDPKINKIRKLAAQREVPVRMKPRKYLKKISQTGTHQGVIAVKNEGKAPSFRQLVEAVPLESSPFFIYIREALYEHNIGAIIRTAEAAGAHGVIIPPKAKITPQVIRISMGGTEHVPVIQEGLFPVIKQAREKLGLKVIGIEVSGENYYYQEDLSGPVLFIIGGEDRPLSDEITSKCDAVVKIPLRGYLNSLNMSVAAGIVLYDKVRQEMSENV
ncbi:MAG: putative TrmH family tRNA/rRNA methyltransferase [candidate division WS6 bacterium OLB20]|uniref:Putative TrmH family tRNA/rRNA methyltransferase n=1 Tax=candidate division WS6 bacterium OLB20 TaxID=1617426 RepID=A0A136LYE0_9BACT|nr:MAG: putative TrmH family tRNA/rRNA methyltransferase [candidate division WS6 bacterium OLB20]